VQCLAILHDQECKDRKLIAQSGTVAKWEEANHVYRQEQ